MKTKIIATIGPASSSNDIIEQMIHMGMDVCRLNFSHGNHKEHLAVIKRVHELNKKHKTFIAIMADLQGPKLRVGTMDENDNELISNETIIITTDRCIGNSKILYINYPDFAKDAKAGNTILLDDGKILLQVIKTNNINKVTCQINQGGRLSSNKGINLPDTSISTPSLTEKDKNDLDFILQQRIQWIALSFVRSANDIEELRQYIHHHPGNRKPLIIAKIEKPQALEDIDNIISKADGIMVARGDLGVEIPLEHVPLVQKELIKKCLKASKPIIVATQMMEGMISNIRPTRAEVNDIANSVMDGADALMLSGETSVGKFPVQVIATMQKIIDHIEVFEDIYFKDYGEAANNAERHISDSILVNASHLAKQVNAKAIITNTHSGYSAYKLASQRPKCDIFVFTDTRKLLSTLSLVWGLRGFYYNKFESTDDTIDDLKNILLAKGLVKKDDLIINIASIPCKDKGMTNMLKLSRV